MAKGKTIELVQARRWAEKIKSQLQPLCEKVEIAGSIRRGQARVHDIDIVCLPKTQTAVNARISRAAAAILGSGAKNLSVELVNGVRLDCSYACLFEQDLFRPATPAHNFGSLLLCRTGPKEFNVWLASRARAKEMQWRPYSGLYRGDRLVAAETERDIFSILELEFIEPERRDHIKP